MVWAVSQRIEHHGDAVHTVSKAGGLGPVIEHVAEVASALAAENLGPYHAQASVRVFRLYPQGEIAKRGVGRNVGLYQPLADITNPYG